MHECVPLFIVNCLHSQSLFLLHYETFLLKKALIILPSVLRLPTIRHCSFHILVLMTISYNEIEMEQN